MDGLAHILFLLVLMVQNCCKSQTWNVELFFCWVQWWSKSSI